MKVPEKLKSLLTYSGKCVAATLLVSGIAQLIGYTDIGWCLISSILVLSPEGEDAIGLALDRIKANIVGAAMGLLCLLISPASMWTISLAITLSLAACYALKLESGTRSAMAAAIIIMLHDAGKHVWDTAMERVIAVFAGCLLGLLVTLAFHRSARRIITKSRESTES